MSMCKISEINGKVSTSCGSAKSSSIMRVKAVPLRVSEQPILNPSIHNSANAIIRSQLQRMADCYNGKLKGGKCIDPIELILFKDEKCSACHEYIPEVYNRLNLMKQYGIPHRLTIYDIRKDNVRDLVKQVGCQGLPCLAMRDIQNPTRLRKITEGIDKPIAFFSKIMNEPNPIIYKVNNNTPPNGLLRRRRL